MALRGLVLSAVVTAAGTGSLAAVQATSTSSGHDLVAAMQVSGSAPPNADHFEAPAPTSTTTPRPQPTAAPMPTHAPAPVSSPVRQRAVSKPIRAAAPPASRPVTPPPSAPPVLRNYLTSGDGTLHAGVGVYADCTGSTPLTTSEAAIDTCITGPTYFVGHNYGVFTPLMHMSVGATITYHDGPSVVHSWRVVSIRDGYPSASGVPQATEPDVVAQFQTCESYSPGGQYDRILDVVVA
jgi:hypothetical protein